MDVIGVQQTYPVPSLQIFGCSTQLTVALSKHPIAHVKLMTKQRIGYHGYIADEKAPWNAISQSPHSLYNSDTLI